MNQSSIKDIINKAIIANRENNYSHEKEMISNFKKAVIDNLDSFQAANSIDLKNYNGFKLDTNILEMILSKYENIDSIINDEDKISITETNLLHSKVYSNLGVVLVLFNGNTYTMLEMILLGLLTHNTIIFAYDEYMLGTNGLLISLIRNILEKDNLKMDMFQETYPIKQELFDNFKSINKTIIIGDNDFITKYLKDSTTETIVSGYNNYDIYIDSLRDIDFINKLIEANYNLNIYINNNLDYEIKDSIKVEDIDEAITQINYNSSKYSSSIFTEDEENASLFLKSIHSKNVFVNTSPTLEQQLDIKQEDLLKEKVIIMPNNIKIDYSNEKKDDIF